MLVKVRSQKYFEKLSKVKAKAAPAFCWSVAGRAASDDVWLSKSAQISEKVHRKKKGGYFSVCNL